MVSATNAGKKARYRVDREAEQDLLRTHEIIGGMDEVGRGSIAGPVSVGLAVVTRATPDDFPTGLADSKQLTPARRKELAPQCANWLLDWQVAHASPAEIDSLGIIGALRLAGLRALAAVAQRGNLPSALILDGTHNWLAAPQGDLFDQGEAAASTLYPTVPTPVTHMMVKGDARCAVVAAASILAKVERDALMTSLEDPGYDWASNKGYTSARHIEGLRRLGPSTQHRRSWHLPGLD